MKFLFRTNRLRQATISLQICLALAFRCLHGAEIDYADGEPFRTEQITGITNWIQYIKPTQDSLRYNKLPGDIPSPKISVEDLQRAVTNRWEVAHPWIRHPPPTIAWGFGQNNEGTLTFWRLRSNGDVAFRTEWDSRWVAIEPSTRIATNGAWAQRRSIAQKWPAPVEIDKVIVSNSWFDFPSREPSNAIKSDAKERLIPAIANGRVRRGATYQESLEWRRHLKLPERSKAFDKDYCDGVLVTKDGKMLLWELYGGNHVTLQDSEGEMLLIEP